MLHIDNKQLNWLRIRSSELILQSRGTERETGKPDRALWQLTQIRKPKAWRLSFPYFNKRQGRIWRTADTKAWYQFFCVFERQGILWNHLKVRTSPRPKKRKALSEKRPWILSLHYWFIDKAETMARVYCICVSGKYLIFYSAGGGFAALGSVWPKPGLCQRSGSGSAACPGEEEEGR